MAARRDRPALEPRVVVLPERVRRLVLEHARQVVPDEAGGLLQFGEDNCTIVGYAPIANVAPIPTHYYQPELQEFRRAFGASRRVAFVHTHPTGEARPTAADRQAFALPWMGLFVPFVIVGFERGEPVFRAFGRDGSEQRLDT